MRLSLALGILFVSLPALAAGPKAVTVADDLGALAAQPALAMSPELAALTRSISLDPASDLSNALAQAVTAKLPESFARELRAAVASGDQQRLGRLTAQLESAKAATAPGIEDAVVTFVTELKARVAENDFTRGRLRASASAVAPLAAWGKVVARQAELLGELSNAATLDVARRWASGLSRTRAAEEPEAVAVPVTAQEAHAAVSEYAELGRTVYTHTVGGILVSELKGTSSRSEPDAGSVTVFAKADQAIIATVGPKGDGDGVTLSWSGPTASRPDGSTAAVWKGHIVDVALDLAQRGWDVEQIGPLRWHIAKRSIAPGEAVAKALRGGLRLAAPPNRLMRPAEKRRPLYTVDADAPTVVRLTIPPATGEKP